MNSARSLPLVQLIVHLIQKPVRVIALAFFVPLLVMPSACDRGVNTWAFHGNTMGTTYSVQVIAPAVSLLEADIEAAIAEQLMTIEALMSTYQAESEVSRFNRLPAGEALVVSKDTLAVLTLAKAVYAQSGGAFDATVGPLVNLWGFGPNDGSLAALSNTAPPTAAAIEALRQQVGMAAIMVDTERNTLLKTRPLEIDLSAIAKGYAVDRLADLLQRAGAEHFLVEIGGELRARGRNAQGQYWRVGVETPVSDLRRQVYAAIQLDACAIATSGDYRNYREHEGRRYSHTIDPRSGRPVKHALASVTVLHPDAALADAWATALAVLGSEVGQKVATAQGIAALFVSRNEKRESIDTTVVTSDKFIPTESPAFSAFRAYNKIREKEEILCSF